MLDDSLPQEIVLLVLHSIKGPFTVLGLVNQVLFLSFLSLGLITYFKGVSTTQTRLQGLLEGGCTLLGIQNI